MVYARPEDEFYHKHSQQSFTFSSERPVAKNELQPMRLAMLLTADQIKAARFVSLLVICLCLKRFCFDTSVMSQMSCLISLLCKE